MNDRLIWSFAKTHSHAEARPLVRTCIVCGEYKWDLVDSDRRLECLHSSLCNVSWFPVFTDLLFPERGMVRNFFWCLC